MPQRFDAAQLGQAHKTPQGFLRAPGRLTRTGVLPYRRADGTIVRELRRPEQVFADASIASLIDAPITDLHPKVMVSAANARELALGHVSAPRRDGRFIAGECVVTDARLIEAIERRDRSEVSLGYNCKLVVGDGVYEGERYDAEQVDIVYNHAAIGPSNWGRAGREVALRLDGSKGDEPALGDGDAWRCDAADEPAGDPPHKEPPPMELVTLRIDGIDVQVPPASSQLITRAIAERDSKLAAADTKASDAQKRADSLQGELDGTKKKLETEADPKRFDAAVRDRIALLDKARKVLGAEVKLDGKSAREIKELVVKHCDSEASFDGKSDEYVQGRFDACEVPAADRADGDHDDDLDKARRASVRRDAADKPPAYEPPPWRKPLSTSRS